MNFNHLRAFYEVAETRNLSAAAKNLFLTQPTVACKIKNLEEYYELKFFERTEKRVILTEEGKVLFDFSDRIFNLNHQTEGVITDLKELTHSAPRSEARGMLRVDTERRFLPRFKNRGLAPSNVLKERLRQISL